MGPSPVRHGGRPLLSHIAGPGREVKPQGEIGSSSACTLRATEVAAFGAAGPPAKPAAKADRGQPTVGWEGGNGVSTYVGLSTECTEIDIA